MPSSGALSSAQDMNGSQRRSTLLAHLNNLRFDFDPNAFRKARQGSERRRDYSSTGIDTSRWDTLIPITGLPYHKDCTLFRVFQSMAIFNHFNGSRPLRWSNLDHHKITYGNLALDNILNLGMSIDWAQSDGKYASFINGTLAQDQTEWTKAHLKECPACGSATELGQLIIRQELSKVYGSLRFWRKQHEKNKDDLENLPKRIASCSDTDYRDEPEVYATRARDEFLHLLATATSWEDAVSDMEALYSRCWWAFSYFDRHRDYSWSNSVHERITQIERVRSWVSDKWDGYTIPVWSDLVRTADNRSSSALNSSLNSSGGTKTRAPGSKSWESKRKPVADDGEPHRVARKRRRA